MGVQENIKKLRELHGLTQKDLGAVIGVTDKAVWTWENGTVEPRMGTLQRLADHFHVPMDVLVEDGGWQRVDPVTKRLKRPFADAKRGAFTSTTKAPLYGRIAAGKPVETMPVEDSLWVDPAVLAAHPHGFFLRVEGESMNRVLPNGSFAFVDPDAEVVNGDVAALNVNGCDATIKRFHRMSTSVVLQADSSDESCTDLIFDYTQPGTDTVTLIGRVVWYRLPSDWRI